jgi:hypothetical protein
MEYLAGLLSALVPEDLRRDLVSRWGVDPPGWSCLLGVIELFGGALWLIDDFLVRIRGLVDQQTDVILAHAEPSGLDADAALAASWSGAFAWLLWLTRPLTLLVALATVTGMVRLVAFGVTREAVPEPLVWVGVRLWQRLAVAPARAAADRQRFGPPRPDRVLAQADGTLLVLTARPRPEWNELIAIEMRERFYRLAGVEERLEGRFRWHAHVFEELPESAVLRGLVRYEPPPEAVPRAAGREIPE